MQPSAKSPSQPTQQERKASQKAANRRLGWILLSIVVAFFLGFVAKMKFLGG
ncbi:cytochrome oxidase small assembly protein [Cupriavidus pauculus]|uniref:cytochrome oxidase small assembly protein n=1 Tax=Cupriavidus pauculus TaxID=82633 RepID=UPI001EE183AE|nr:cytochrome oxidase small assembly protein [Cupriavidus pauculus]GJG95922.1 hypothetical protein CBA19C6_15555 [Cupriavidus pauculus]